MRGSCIIHHQRYQRSLCVIIFVYECAPLLRFVRRQGWYLIAVFSTAEGTPPSRRREDEDAKQVDTAFTCCCLALTTSQWTSCQMGAHLTAIFKSNNGRSSRCLIIGFFTETWKQFSPIQHCFYRWWHWFTWIWLKLYFVFCMCWENNFMTYGRPFGPEFLWPSERVNMYKRTNQKSGWGRK